MPFTMDDTADVRQPIGQASPDAFLHPTPEETIGAAFRQNNPIASVLDAISRSREDMRPQEGYDPIPRVVGTKYEPYIDRFLADQNPAQTDARMAKIDSEENDRRILAQSGWAGTVTSVAAGALDPTWFIPLVGEARAGEELSVLGRIGRGAAEGALRSSVSEAALMGSQQTRTQPEAFADIATNTILMGLLGGARGMLAPDEARSALRGVEEARKDLSPAKPDAPIFQGVPEPVQPNRLALANDLSAATSDRRDMELSRIGLPPKIQAALRDIPGVGQGLDLVTALNMRLSPTLRIFSSDSLVAKRAMGDMAETSLRFTQSERGVPTARGGVPVDRLVKMQQHSMKLETGHILRDQFLAYRQMADKKLGMQQAALADVRGQAGGKMSYPEFKEAVSSAAINGDAHPVPEVATAAAKIRGAVLDPVTKMAQAVKGPDGQPMLVEELAPPKGDKSFWPRLWNKVALAARYNDAKRIFSDWLESEQGRKLAIRDQLEDLQRRHAAATDEGEKALLRDKMEEKIGQWGGKTTNEAVAALKAREKAEGARADDANQLKAADRAVDKAIEKIVSSDKLDLTRAELESRAAQIIDRINAAPDGRIPYDIGNGGPKVGFPAKEQQVRGSLNSRDFAIPTSLVKDFVEKDAEHVIAAHLRTAIPDIHLTDRFGDVDMEDVFRQLNEEYDVKRSEATSERELVRLDNERKAMNRDLAATRDRIRGVYGWELAKTQPNAARIANAARNYNLIADLGTSVFNRLTDSVNAVYRHGFMNVLSDGYMPFFRSLARMDGQSFSSAAKQSMRDMAIGVDSALGHMSHQFGDVLDNVKPGSKFERALAWGANKAMILNLHGPWTDGMKTIAGTVAAADILRTAGRVANGSASAADHAALARSGIEPFMAERIWKAFGSEDGGQTFGGRTHVANTSAWTDSQARAVFASAVARDADAAVLTPGAEKPLWMSGPVVSLLGQYKSFIAAAHEKLLIANLQQADARTLQGLAASLGIGMLSYRLYTLLSGMPASNRPQDWIKEGISRSAITGWFSEINSMQAKFTGGATDMFRMIGADRPLSRRASNSALSDMLGPTYSKLEGMKDALNAASHGTWTAGDTHKLRQAAILQNLWFVRRLLDEAEEGFNEFLGVKPRDRSATAWP
jgi:hypothetical protein